MEVRMARGSRSAPAPPILLGCAGKPAAMGPPSDVPIRRNVRATKTVRLDLCRNGTMELLMARKTWPNPCSAEDVARESSDMPNEALMVPGEMSECRALVVAGAAVEPRRAERPQAAFLTQLIACER